MKKATIAIIFLALMLQLLVPVMAVGVQPVITMQPQNRQYPAHAVAIYSVTAEGDNLHAYWYMEWNGTVYNISEIGGEHAQQPWEGYAGAGYGPHQYENTFSYIFEGIETELDGAEIWCTVEDGHYQVTSDRAVITVSETVKMPPEIVSVPASVTAAVGSNVEIRCVAKSVDDTQQLMYVWYETSSGKLQDVIALSDDSFSDFISPDTSTPGTRYYVCGVFTTEDGSSITGGYAYSSVIPVTVLDPDGMLAIVTQKLPEAKTGAEYSAKIEASNPNATFNISYNPGGENDFDKTGLTLNSDGKITGKPLSTGEYTFTVCASANTGEAYMEYTLSVVEPVYEFSTSEWAEEEMKDAAAKGLVPSELLDKDLSKLISREEFAEVCVLVFEYMTGTKVPSAPDKLFTDTDNEMVSKASLLGFTNGTSEKQFTPKAGLTREQAATMLTRVYKKYVFENWTLKNDSEFSLSKTIDMQTERFADDGDISEWAKESVYFMASSGVINGVGENRFAPRPLSDEQRAAGMSQCTREQAIAIAKRMADKFIGDSMFSPDYSAFEK